MKINTSAKSKRSKSISARSSKASASPKLTARMASGAQSALFEETRAQIKPNGATVKPLIATLKAGIATARLCALMYELHGPKAPYVLPYGWLDETNKLVRMISDPWYKRGAPNMKVNKAHNLQWFGGSDHARHLSEPDLWEWVFNYWQSGGYDRNHKALLSQLPDEDRARVEKYRKQVDKIELPYRPNWPI